MPQRTLVTAATPEEFEAKCLRFRQHCAKEAKMIVGVGVPTVLLLAAGETHARVYTWMTASEFIEALTYDDTDIDSSCSDSE